METDVISEGISKASCTSIIDFIFTQVNSLQRKIKLETLEVAIELTRSSLLSAMPCASEFTMLLLNLF